jgi:hypothetical protein
VFFRLDDLPWKPKQVAENSDTKQETDSRKQNNKNGNYDFCAKINAFSIHFLDIYVVHQEKICQRPILNFTPGGKL